MNVIGKTDPKEAEKVASEAEASVPRKRRHAGSHYEYTEANDTPQGTLNLRNSSSGA
jgi:hypothetical protein